jgi:NADH-quinone oxidoreductase subunit G
LFLLGADEIAAEWMGKAFVIYLGSHGDQGAHRADVILPGAAYTEKPGIYVNTEGRTQIANRAVFPKGDAKEDWSIFRALSEDLGHRLPYDSLEALRRKLIQDHPTFGQVDHAPGHVSAATFDAGAIGAAGEVADAPFQSPVTEFHLTNPIARASVTMAECARSLKAARGLLAAE